MVARHRPAGISRAVRSMGTRQLEPRRREPLWSRAITPRLAALIPSGQQDEALTAIKAIHTGLFASIAGCIVVALSDGVRGRPKRRTAIAGALVLVETAVYVSNNQVCPLTPLAEELGAARGSVADIFLPAWAARRIPIVAGSVTLLALVLNIRALRARSARRSSNLPPS